MKTDSPLVSIWCATYNHRNYLEGAIKSFLQQETDFEYEIIIHDDASTDGTDEIIHRYVKEYPGKIKAVIQPQNLYSRLSTKEFCAIITAAKEEKTSGKYVALCEGDDFWIDRHKLQIQIEYMESHPECVMTTHNAVIEDSMHESILKAMNPYDCDKDLSMEELIMWYHGNVPSASIVLRREYAVRKGFFAGTMASGDLELQLYCATKGKIHYIDRIMSCYRANTPSSYTRNIWADDRKRCGIRLDQMYFFLLFDRYTKGAYREFISKKLYDILIMLFKENSDRDIEQFRLLCDQQGKEKGVKYNRFLYHITEAFRRFKDDNFCVEYLKQFANTHQYILIMGAGCFGKKMANALTNNNLDFEGFVVSNGHKQNEKECGKPVWELDELPFDKNQCGVIISMEFIHYSEVVRNLKRCGINKYTYYYGIIGD